MSRFKDEAVDLLCRDKDARESMHRHSMSTHAQVQALLFIGEQLEAVARVLGSWSEELENGKVLSVKSYPGDSE